MQKTIPSPLRLLVIVAFALSCFSIALYLWLSFGGPTPLKPEGYRFKVAFGSATQLGTEADVRIAGVKVGKVAAKERSPQDNRTLATLELDPEFAPIPADAKATLRQKTLLGETFVELTPGTGAAPKVRDGGRLSDVQVKGTVEFDEILDVFDEPTRRSYRTWQQDMGEAMVDRGRSLNDALSVLPPFLEDGTELLEVLDTERGAVQRLVKNTGVVFGALTRREDQLRGLIVNTSEVFDETARRNDRIAETLRILPTFLTESRRTFRRTETFARRSRPIVRLLRAPTRDLGPTFSDLRALAPDLERNFRATDRLVTASRDGLPAQAESLRGVRPFLAELGPFLSELNPFLQVIEQNQGNAADFFGTGGTALADTLATENGTGHYLRQFGPTGTETAGIFRERLPSNRGTAYVKGNELADPRFTTRSVGPNFDCKPAGGERDPQEGATPDERDLGCWVQSPSTMPGLTGQFPRVTREDYTGGRRGAAAAAARR